MGELDDDTTRGTTDTRLGARDPRVDHYIRTLSPWMSDRAEAVRQLVHAADPRISETIKRTDRPYFVHRGNVIALQGTRDHLNVFVYDPDVADPAGLIGQGQGQGNATARSIQLWEDTPLDAAAFLELVAAIAARNDLGGWRRLRD